MNIESRIEALEAKLAPVDPDECRVFIIVAKNVDGSTDLVPAYSDGAGHTILREPGESPQDFDNRAVEWVRCEHPPKRANCGFVLTPVHD